MDFFHHIFEYRFLANALLAAVLSGVVCGVAGAWVVSRRMVFLSGGITHASFGGIGIAYYMGLNPVAGAFVFAVLSAVGIEWASQRGRIRSDSATGIVWSLGMAVGVIFIALTPGYAPNLMSFLFGNILTATTTDIIALGVLCVVLIAVFALMMRLLVYAAFDPAFARSRGVPVGFLSYMMATLTAAAIVLSIRSVGIVLLISLLTLPAVIVNTLSGSYVRITVWSAVVATAGNVAGLWISYRADIPASAATIFLLAVTLVAVKLLTLYRARRTRPAT